MHPDLALDGRRRRLRRLRRAQSLGPALLAVLVIAFSLGGCSRSETYGDDEHPPPDRVVDVPPPIEVATEDDIQEPPRRQGLAGVLPGDFPPDLAIHLPSSVVDFGPGEVELLTASSPAQVRATLRSKLEASGWTVASHGGGFQLRKGERSASLTVAGGQGTTYRYRY